MAEYDWGCVPKGQTQSTSEFIDKGKLIKRIYQRTANDKSIHIGCMATFINLVNAQPTADVREVVHGEWLYPYKTKHYKRCSACGMDFYAIPWDSKFCPNCGADMRPRGGDAK